MFRLLRFSLPFFFITKAVGSYAQQPTSQELLADYKKVWDGFDLSKAYSYDTSNLEFPFDTVDFDRPELFKFYWKKSADAYFRSRYLLPICQDNDIGAHGHSYQFLYPVCNSPLKYKPQEIYYLTDVFNVLNSLPLYSDQIKALVINTNSLGFHGYGEEDNPNLHQILALFRNVRYLEIIDADHNGSRILMDIILKNKAFDQLEYFSIGYLSPAHTAQVRERYHSLKSWVVCYRFSHDAETLKLPSPLSDCQKLADFRHLRYLGLKSWNDSIIIKSTSVEVLKLDLTGYCDQDILIIAPNLKVLEIYGKGNSRTPDNIKVTVKKARKLESVKIEDTDVLTLKLNQSLKNLKHLVVKTGFLKYYSKHKLPKDTQVNLLVKYIYVSLPGTKLME